MSARPKSLLVAPFLCRGNQHQGTRVTSPTASVPEVTWFPDVVFAEEALSLAFAQVFGGVVTFVRVSVVSVVYPSLSGGS